LLRLAAQSPSAAFSVLLQVWLLLDFAGPPTTIPVPNGDPSPNHQLLLAIPQVNRELD